MAAPHHPEHGDPKAEFIRLLKAQAQAAGLAARDIEQRFRARAEQEAERIESGEITPREPIGTMHFSKSHIHRLYKGSAPLPSLRFTRIFLEITSTAARLPRERHAQLCREAEALLADASRHSRAGAPPVLPAATFQPQDDGAVTVLRLRVELEQAQRTEVSLRWALSDAHLLMNTLLHIITTLRDIVSELDMQQARMLPAGTDTRAWSRAEEQRLRAFTHKQHAETQFDRVNRHRRTLEALWEHARAELHRLSRHPGVTPPPLETHGPRGGQSPVVVLQQELLARPVLDDIARALAKVDALNTDFEQTAFDLAHQADTPLGRAPGPADDDAELLYRAASHSDPALRRVALWRLVERPPDTRLRDVLLQRISADTDVEIRQTSVTALGEHWSADPQVRTTLLDLVHTDRNNSVRTAAVYALRAATPSDPQMRQTMLELACTERNEDIQIAAAQALGATLPRDPTAADVVPGTVLRLARTDPDEDVRLAALHALSEGWPRERFARDALLKLAHTDSSGRIRRAAAALASQGEPKDEYARSRLVRQGDADVPP